MCAYATTEENRTTLIEPPITPTMPWRVQQVDTLPDYRLFVRFLDGLEGYVNLKTFLFSEQAGVFIDLRDPGLFAQAALVYGARATKGHPLYDSLFSRLHHPAHHTSLHNKRTYDAVGFLSVCG